jgi:hypothetical protein
MQARAHAKLIVGKFPGHFHGSPARQNVSSQAKAFDDLVNLTLARLLHNASALGPMGFGAGH